MCVIVIQFIEHDGNELEHRVSSNFSASITIQYATITPRQRYFINSLER